MIYQEDWEKIQGQKQVAETIVTEFRNSSQHIVNLLKDGVELAVAVRIINDYWAGDVSAPAMKAQLSSEFPVTNGEVILNAPLTKKTLELSKGNFEEVRIYFDEIHGFILRVTKELTADLNTADLNDADALARFNLFRKETLRYLDYSDNYFYEVRDLLKQDSVTDWSQLTVVPTRVADGDYLFITDFMQSLVDCQGVYFIRTLDKTCEDNTNLHGINWSSEQIIAQLKLPYLFAQWLLQFHPAS